MQDGCPPKGKGCNAQKGKKLPNAWLADDECILPNEPNLTLPYLMAYTTTLGIHVTAKATCRFMKHNVKSWMKVQSEKWPCCPPLINLHAEARIIGLEGHRFRLLHCCQQRGRFLPNSTARSDAEEEADTTAEEGSKNAVDESSRLGCSGIRACLLPF
jgi:hypothetical protein